MNKFATRVMAFALCATVMSAAAALAANPVRISQVYGAGGNSGATYNQDYVELFNNSGSPVNIGGWSLQYGSATGTAFGSTATNAFIFPANTIIQPCKYLLVTLATGANGVPLPVAGDLNSTTSINLSGTTGKIALINNSTINNLCSGSTIGGIYVDVLGFGTGNCYETAVGPGISTTNAAFRNGGGTADTDNNANDFTAAAAAPRNSSSPANIGCLATPTNPKTWGSIKTIYR